MKNIHKGTVLTEKEVLENRSDAYEFIDFDKSETFENAFEIFMKTNFSGQITKGLVLGAMKFGVKWQSERSYSEEEIEKLISLLKQTTEYEVLQSFRDKVEQLKKK